MSVYTTSSMNQFLVGALDEEKNRVFVNFINNNNQ